MDTPNNNDDTNKNNPIFGPIGKQSFQTDFVRGCLSFLTLAILVKGESETTSADALFNSFIEPIVGNRNPDNTPFPDVMPELYKKVIAYCHDAITISESIEDSELED